MGLLAAVQVVGEVAVQGLQADDGRGRLQAAALGLQADDGRGHLQAAVLVVVEVVEGLQADDGRGHLQAAMLPTSRNSRLV